MTVSVLVSHFARSLRVERVVGKVSMVATVCPIVLTICDYAGGVYFVSYIDSMVNSLLFTFWWFAYFVIY